MKNFTYIYLGLLALLSCFFFFCFLPSSCPPLWIADFLLFIYFLFFLFCINYWFCRYFEGFLKYLINLIICFKLLMLHCPLYILKTGRWIKDVFRPGLTSYEWWMIFFFFFVVLKFFIRRYLTSSFCSLWC